MQQGTKYGTPSQELDDSESWSLEHSTRDASYVAPMGERRIPTPLPEVDYALLSLRLPEIAPSQLPKLAIRPPPPPSSPGQPLSRTQGPRASWPAAPPQRSGQLDDSELEISVTEVTRERISPPLRSPSPPPRVKRALHRRLAWGGAGLLPCVVIGIALCVSLAQQRSSSAQREQAATLAAAASTSSRPRAPAVASTSFRSPAPARASTAPAPPLTPPRALDRPVAAVQPATADRTDPGLKPRLEKPREHRSKRPRGALAKRVKRGKGKSHHPHRRHHHS